MLVLDHIRCTQRTLLCDPFFRSSGRKLLRQPEAAPVIGYRRRLAAAAARWRQSGDEFLQVSQIAVDPVGLHIILLCLLFPQDMIPRRVGGRGAGAST